MLYMVEMDMPHAERLAAWHTWYDAHVQRLLGMPGFCTAQRFVTNAPAAAPYLAVYSVTDATALSNPTYTTRAGPQSASDWAPFMNNWRRNLVDGLDEAPAVGPSQWLALFDRESDAAPALPAGYTVLRPAGLDGTVVERGLMVGATGVAPPLAAQGPHWSLRIALPLSPRLRAAAG